MFERPLKTDPIKRYYYHLTYYDLGDEVNLKPLFGDNRAEDEPPGERICVSNHPAKCFVAIPLDGCDRLHLYRTKEKITAKYSYGICDRDVTGEKWLTEETPSIRILHIDPIMDDEPHSDIFKVLNEYSFVAGDGDFKSKSHAKKASWELSRLDLFKQIAKPIGK